MAPHGLNPRSMDGGNIELGYALKLAWVIYAAVFGKTWKTGNLTNGA